MRDDILRAEEDPFQVDVEDEIPLLQGRALNGAVRLDAGVVVQHVDATKGRGDIVYHALHLVGPGDVDEMKNRLPTFPVNRCDTLFAGSFIDIDEPTTAAPARASLGRWPCRSLFLRR